MLIVGMSLGAVTEVLDFRADVRVGELDFSDSKFTLQL